MRQELEALAQHIEALDSGSGDAAAIRWGLAEIDSMERALEQILSFGSVAQPIETAPTDGTEILIWCTERKAWQSARWVQEVHDAWEQVDATTKKLVRNKNGYWDTLAQSWDFWMPQPPAPK
jgi:hypothetical protein